MNNIELDQFIKSQAQEAEKEFKARLERIVDDWKDKSSEIIESMYEVQQQFNADVDKLRKEFSADINKIKEELGRQSGVIIEQSNGNTKTIVIALADQEEKIAAFNQAQNNKLEKISTGLDLQIQNNQKTERQLGDFLANQTVQIDLGQKLLDKQVVLVKDLQRANENIEKNESVLLSTNQMLSSEFQALKNSILEKIEADAQSTKRKIASTFGWTITVLLAIIVMLIGLIIFGFG